MDAGVVIVKDSAWAGAHVSGIFIPSLFVLGLEKFKASVNLMNIDAKWAVQITYESNRNYNQKWSPTCCENHLSSEYLDSRLSLLDKPLNPLIYKSKAIWRVKIKLKA